MHDCASEFHIFSNHVGATDIHQGALGNCYALAAYASLAQIDNGWYVRNVFETKVVYLKNFSVKFIIGRQ